MTTNKVQISPPPTSIQDKSTQEWSRWFNRLYNRVGDGPFKLRTYSKSNLPTESDWGHSGTANSFTSLIGVYDETSGFTIAFSDGTNWRRVQDRSIIT